MFQFFISNSFAYNLLFIIQKCYISISKAQVQKKLIHQHLISVVFKCRMMKNLFTGHYVEEELS